MSLQTPCIGDDKQQQEMHGVCESRLEGCHQHQEMCSAEHETQRVDAIQRCWAASDARRPQGEAGTDSSRPVKKGVEASASAGTSIAPWA